MEQIVLNVQEVIFVAGGDINVETGICGHGRTYGTILRGGNGTYVTISRNKIIAKGKVQDEDMEFNVLYSLRQALGLYRLVKPKRDKLVTRFPKSLTFVKGERGFWDLSDSSAQEWLVLAGLTIISR